MEVTLAVIGCYVVTVLSVGLASGWHRGATEIKVPGRRPERRVVWLDANTFKVEG